MIYMDIMLDIGHMRQVGHEDRQRIVVERLIDEVPTVVHKYAVPNFDELRFIDDFNKWISGLTKLQSV